MNLSQDEIDKLLSKMNDAVNNKKDTEFTDKEISVLKEVIEAWSTWKSIGVGFRYFVWILLTFAGIMVAWRQIKEEVLRWLGLQ